MTVNRRFLMLDLIVCLAVAWVALVPRLELAGSYGEPPQSEEELYNRYAVPWSRGEGTEPREKPFPWHPYGSVTHRPSGYVVFLGTIYRLTGTENFAAVRLVQAWLDTSGLLLLYVAGILIFGGVVGRAAGLTAALAIAQYDFAISFVARLLSETLFTWLSLLAIVLMLWAVRRDQPQVSLLGAFVLGWANLVRTFLLLMLPAYLLWLLIAPGLKRRRKHLVLAALGIVLAVAPVTYRNWQFHRELILVSTNSGYTLWHGLVQVDDLSAPEQLGTKEEVKALELGETAEQAEFRERAIRYLVNHPEDWPAILARRVRILLAAKSGHKISHVLTATPDDEWLFPLLLAGAVASVVVRPRRAWHARLLLWLVIGSQVVVSLLANAEVRYRVPVMPLLALLAAWSLWGTVELAAPQLRPGGLWRRDGRGTEPPTELPAGADAGGDDRDH